MCWPRARMHGEREERVQVCGVWRSIAISLPKKHMMVMVCLYVFVLVAIVLSQIRCDGSLTHINRMRNESA